GLGGWVGKGGRLFVVTGSPGDRTDDEIRDIARAVCEARPHGVYVRELVNYLRGREAGVVPELMRTSLLANGLREEAFSLVGSEVEALRAALADAREGDVVALLVHLDRAEVKEFLASR